MWSRCSAGSAVALCGGRGGHRLLSCAAAPAQRRAPGASASAKGIPRSALRASVTPEFVTAAPDEAVEVSVPSDAFRRTGGGLGTRARVLLGLRALRVSQELETGREISLQYVFNCKL